MQYNMQLSIYYKGERENGRKKAWQWVICHGILLILSKETTLGRKHTLFASILSCSDRVTMKWQEEERDSRRGGEGEDVENIELMSVTEREMWSKEMHE